MLAKLNKVFQGDKVIWVVFFLLCMVSMVEVYSSASSLTYKTGAFYAPLIKQALFLSLGTGVAVLIHNVPCRFFKAVVLVVYLASLIMLAYTLLSGQAINDGARWIKLPGFTLQPSELAKGSMVGMVAFFLSMKQDENGANPKVFGFLVAALLLTCSMIVSENLSTCAILFVTVLIMMFVGRVPWRQFMKLLVPFVLAGGLLYGFLVTSSPDNPIYELGPMHRALSWRARLVGHDTDITTVDFSRHTKQDTMLAKNYVRENFQKAHANFAIASCNFVGKLPGNSEQRDALPQSFSDFIYAIIIEELGLWGGALVCFLYIVLLARAGRIASRCERNFPALLSMGLGTLLCLQALVNMAVAVGWGPITGQPLPLISRGGTSTLITCVYFGMILSVSRYARRSESGKADIAMEEARTQA